MNYDALQQQIIEIDRGEHLVLAPPGCGKTAILAERVCRAVKSGVNPADMLCLTFTNRAARGMEGRITGMMGDAVTETLFVGNIHKYCANYLFSNGLLPQSGNILDEKDCESVFEEIIDPSVTGMRELRNRSALNSVMKLEHLIHQFRHGHPNSIATEVPDLPTIAFDALCQAAGIKTSKSGYVRLFDEIHSISERVDPVLHSQAIAWMKLAHEYHAYKCDNNLIDFDDILLLAYDSMRDNPDHKRYDWLQIDEVQDLNPLQMAIADMLRGESENSVALYLGDEQQAIFSFIGASPGTLTRLRERCGANCHSLSRNYRSPRYLLDIFNRYAVANLGAREDNLPVADNDSEAGADDLRLCYADNNLSSPKYVAKMACRQLQDDETCAVIVARNSEADEVSAALHDAPHFKISGKDFFSTTGMQLILSHLNVLNCEHNFLAWSRLLHATGLAKTLSQGRKTMKAMEKACISPTDFFRPDGLTYVQGFLRDTSRPTVIFDTETTGLDVCRDDIVQIAALKIIDGKVVDKLNLLLRTDRDIPPMLGELPNPLVKEYANGNPGPRKESLEQFMAFARGCTLVGHNVEFDYHILDNNLRREQSAISLRAEHPERYDTLKLSRLVYPRLRSHKLKDLLAELHLEGENSHLADDDIVATHSLMRHLLATVSKEETMLNHLKIWQRAQPAFGARMREVYMDLYNEGIRRLHVSDRPAALVDEMKRVASHFSEAEWHDELAGKFDYVVRLVEKKVAELPDGSPTLARQLSSLIMEMNTYRETDLCESGAIKERLFIATVHKAKGLEFDNVIVYGAVDGTYPSLFSKTDACRHEDARKLYVALSRAKKRLTIHCYHNFVGVSRTGNTFSIDKDMSPYLLPVRDAFRRTASKIDR